MDYSMYLWHVLEHKEPRCGVFMLFITLISIESKHGPSDTICGR